MKTLLKKTYKLVPFKHMLFSVLKKLWKPKEAVFKHLHFAGIINVPIDQSRAFKMKHYGFQLENEIFWKGLSQVGEKDSINLWIRLCDKSDIIFDLGSNTGIYSLIAKTVNPNASVYAFEPVKRVFNKLQKNILLNNFNIIAVEKAVSNASGNAKIYDTMAEHIYSVTVNKDLSSPGIVVKEIEIETITLDHFIKVNDIRKIDLMKIDVETHEPEVLEGFIAHLRFFKPTILIEVLNDEVGNKIQKATEGLGYLYFNLNEKGTIRRVEKITKSDYFNYLLCDNNTALELGI